jgi:phytanoyl-CoA hydroxylase
MAGTTAEQSGSSDIGTDGLVPDELVAAYRTYGFVRIHSGP